MRRFILQTFSQQHLFQRVQAPMVPWIQVTIEFCIEQPVVHEGGVLLVCQVRQDDQLEEPGILVVEEEVQLVAGVLRIKRPLFRILESRPTKNETELGECLITG